METLIPLKEVAHALGLDETALKRRCQRGRLPGALKEAGRWVIPASVVSALKDESGIEEYEEVLAAWIHGMERGIGYKKPISPRGVEAQVYGLAKFWLFLERPPAEIKQGYKKDEERPKPFRKPNLADVTMANLQIALGNIPIDRVERKCHFSLREQMYKGFKSFLKFLVSKGLKSRVEYLDFCDNKELRPVRVYEEVRPSLTEDELLTLISTNDAIVTGRSKKTREHDRLLTKMIIYLAAFVGLRNEEIQDLAVSHVNIKEQEISVIDGKGNKNRVVGFSQEVRDLIKEWLAVRPKSTHPNLLLTNKGAPLDNSGVHKRIVRVGAAAGLTITPHGLRRTCASVALEHGIPIHHIAETFGHTRTSTTEKSYAKASKKHVLNSFKNFRPLAPAEKVEAEPAKTRERDYW